MHDDPGTGTPAGAGAATLRAARLACRVVGVPTAVVTLRTPDGEVVAGSVGWDGPWPSELDVRSVGTGSSVVVDVARPVPGGQGRGPHTAVAGHPLLDAGGTPVGALWALDPGPRTWSATELAALADLAGACAAELQLGSARADEAAATELVAQLQARHERDQDRWALAREAGRVGSFDWELATGRLDWDDQLLTLFGYTADEFDHTIGAFNDRLHPDDVERVGRTLAGAIEACGLFEAEYRIQHPDGATRWVRARGHVLGGAGGSAERLVGVAHDATAAHEGETRTARLLEAMPSGFLTLDHDWRLTSLNAAAEVLVGSPRRDLLGRTVWESFPDMVGTEFEAAYREAVATGTPQTLTAYYPAPLDAWYDVLCWPNPDGLALYFNDTTARVRAARAAEAAAARLALLAEVSQALVDAVDIAEVLTALPRLLVPALADACVVTVVGPDGRARDVSARHADPALDHHLQGYARHRLDGLTGETPFAQVLRAGQVRHLTAEQTATVPMHPTARAHLDNLGPVRASILPLRGQGRTHGALTLLSAAGRPRDLDQETTTRTIADRLGAGLETARLTRARVELAEDLQRSLLTAPPEPDHAEVVVRYFPAAEAARVGGDWYDAFLQPDGATVVVIGDVAGHDTAAAAVMGQLRGLLRGIATYSGSGPAEVLRGLDAAMRLLRVDALATAAVARFEQTPEEVEAGTTRMLWSSAGHPAPLVLHADGRVEDLAAGKADLLLGVDPTAARGQTTTTLDRGATVLLYTDGLVERRDADLDDGTRRLVAAVADLADVGLDELCDGVVQRLVDGRPEDDVALVAVRLHRQDRPRPVEAGPQVVPEGVPAPQHPAQ